MILCGLFTKYCCLYTLAWSETVSISQTTVAWQFQSKNTTGLPWDSPIFQSPKQNIVICFQTASKAGAKSRVGLCRVQSYRSKGTGLQFTFFKHCVCCNTTGQHNYLLKKACSFLKTFFNGEKGQCLKGNSTWFSTGYRMCAPSTFLLPHCRSGPLFREPRLTFSTTWEPVQTLYW